MAQDLFIDEALKDTREALKNGHPAMALAALRRGLSRAGDEPRLWRLYPRVISALPQLEIGRELVAELAYCLTKPELATVEVRHAANGLFQRQAFLRTLAPRLEGLRIRGFSELARDPERKRFLANLSHPLVLSLLIAERIPYRETELLLAALRREFLLAAVDGELESLLWQGSERFLAALACQCFLNEYIYLETEEEGGALATLGEEPKGLHLLLRACYRPLYERKEAPVLPNSLEGSREGELLLRLQWDEPRLEAALRRKIPSLTGVADDTSQTVRAQYEDNPYPRWFSLPGPGTIEPDAGAMAFLRRCLPKLSPEKLPRLPERPEVLVAGCGTGRQACNVARRLPSARVTALDLSLSSLAYARRKAGELGFSNINFAQGDILELGGLEREFDMIFCSGVLHHLAEPEAGLAALKARLRPYGAMNLALYSRTARRYLGAAKAKIAELGFPDSAEGIRAARYALMTLPEGNPAREVTAWLDFYSLSDCRDALFHVQEREFDPDELAGFLAAQGLDFLGFQALNTEVWKAYAKRFPGDTEGRNLDNWTTFEPDHPLTFVAMYNFWVKL